MSQPTLDNIEARAMNALAQPECTTLAETCVVVKHLAQVILDLVQHVRTLENVVPTPPVE